MMNSLPSIEQTKWPDGSLLEGGELVLVVSSKDGRVLLLDGEG